MYYCPVEVHVHRMCCIWFHSVCQCAVIHFQSNVCIHWSSISVRHFVEHECISVSLVASAHAQQGLQYLVCVSVCLSTEISCLVQLYTCPTSGFSVKKLKGVLF